MFWSKSCEGRNAEPIWGLGSGSPWAPMGAGSFSRSSP
ncbi:rCG27845, partial [Rattus norvegicus]